MFTFPWGLLFYFYMDKVDFPWKFTALPGAHHWKSSQLLLWPHYHIMANEVGEKLILHPGLLQAPTGISPSPCPFCLWIQMGMRSLGWKRPRIGQVWVTEWPHEEVQSPQGEHPLSTVMWEREWYASEILSYLIIQHKILYPHKC